MARRPPRLLLHQPQHHVVPPPWGGEVELGAALDRGALLHDAVESAQPFDLVGPLVFGQVETDAREAAGVDDGFMAVAEGVGVIDEDLPVAAVRADGTPMIAAVTRTASELYRMPTKSDWVLRLWRLPQSNTRSAR